MKKTNIVQNFILNEVQKHPADMAMVLTEKFGFSRQRAHHYLSKEIEKGNLIKTGESRWTRYFLAKGNYINFIEKIKPDLAEDKIWSKYVKPLVLSFSENIYRICAYGFTEIFNNAIDHSKGTIIYTEIEIKKNVLSIKIADNGIGIFKKIQEALNLDSPREAILHLSKGKFTTDPTKHSGQGIFFTSRMFDSFSIISGNMHYVFHNRDWVLSSEKDEEFGKGTQIIMKIALNSQRSPKEIFDQYADLEIGFHKTVVAVALSADPNDPHVSRSQAKRLLMGLEKFRTIVLDFKGVGSVGQAFVDEIFRVFKNEHPGITILYVDANEEVEQMIKRGMVNL